MRLIHPKQQTLADKSGVSISTFRRALAFFIKHGFIAVKNNGANKSCWYKVSKWFENTDIVMQLMRKLPIFYFALYIPMMAARAAEYRCINVFNIKNLYITTNIQCNNNKYDNVNTLASNKQIVRGKSMNAYESAKLKLKLTRVGQAELVLFEEEAVRYALDEYLKIAKRKNIEKPFGLFMAIAHRYSKQYNLPIDKNKHAHFQKLLRYTVNDLRSELEKKHTPRSIINNDYKNNDKVVMNNSNRLKFDEGDLKTSDNVYIVEDKNTRLTKKMQYSGPLSNSSSYVKMKQLEKGRIPLKDMSRDQLATEIENWQKNIDTPSSNQFLREIAITSLSQAVEELNRRKTDL